MKKPLILSTVFLFIVACSSAEDPSKSLVRNGWQVEEIVVGDSVVKITSEEHPTLKFNADSTFSGQTNCNSMSGTYQLSPSEEIAMSIEAITTAFCPDNTVEGIFIEQLGLSQSYAIENDTLRLKDGNGRTGIKLTNSKY